MDIVIWIMTMIGGLILAIYLGLYLKEIRDELRRMNDES